MSILNRLRSAPSMSHVNSIKQRWAKLRNLRDMELVQWRTELAKQSSTQSHRRLNPTLIDAIALFAEAMRRTLGIELYDIQLFGGLVTSTGRVAEMQTGEGKTFVTAIPAFVHGLPGQGVHVATTNAYLAARDFSEVKPVFELVGATIGLLNSDQSLQETKAAYDCDVTYGTGYQFGFDFLRDQLARQQAPAERMGGLLREAISGDELLMVRQRGWHMAVIDEIDSVLIDEALTPLVLSGTGAVEEDPRTYQLANHVVKSFVADKDFALDMQRGQIHLNAESVERTTPHNCHVQLVRPWKIYLQNALRANHLLLRDEHYVVQNNEVGLVDQCTGRIFSDRKWRDGLHQAVQAKERVEISPSESSLAQITRQRYFQGYTGLCGLTGTITGSHTEFRNTYQLQCTTIPTHRPSQRSVLPIRFFGTATARDAAIVEDVSVRHMTQQPILIGTQSIQQTHDLSNLLRTAKIAHVVLNGLQNESEAEIVSKAGESGSVVVATNMAGRGTDIKLEDHAKELGGLHVIGVGPNQSRRIDRQLIGRSGRQGDPGSAQFFISAEDDVITKHAPQFSEQLLRNADTTGECHRDFTAKLLAVQTAVEQQQAAQREQMLKRDKWIDSMRKSLFSKRA